MKLLSDVTNVLLTCAAVGQSLAVLDWLALSRAILSQTAATQRHVQLLATWQELVLRGPDDEVLTAATEKSRKTAKARSAGGSRGGGHVHMGAAARGMGLVGAGTGLDSGMLDMSTFGAVGRVGKGFGVSGTWVGSGGSAGIWRGGSSGKCVEPQARNIFLLDQMTGYHFCTCDWAEPVEVVHVGP